MEWIVRQLRAKGKLLEAASRDSTTRRGRISLQPGSLAGRPVLVAELLCSDGKPPPAPLYDVHLGPTIGSMWQLSGLQVLRAGPMADEYHVAQLWLLEGAIDEDYLAAQAGWGRCARELNELRARGTASPGAARDRS